MVLLAQLTDLVSSRWSWCSKQAASISRFWNTATKCSRVNTIVTLAFSLKFWWEHRRCFIFTKEKATKADSLLVRGGGVGHTFLCMTMNSCFYSCIIILFINFQKLQFDERLLDSIRSFLLHIFENTYHQRQSETGHQSYQIAFCSSSVHRIDFHWWFDNVFEEQDNAAYSLTFLEPV